MRTSAACLGILLSGFGLVGCGHAPEATGGKLAKPAEPLVAPVVPVSERAWRTSIRSQGSLIADESTVVGTRVAGRVAEVPVDLGDAVEAGALLAQIDREELELQALQARAQLAQACAVVGLKASDDEGQLNRENSPPVRQEKAVVDEARSQLERLRLLHKQNAVTMADLDQSEAAVAVAEARFASALNSVDEKIALIKVRRAELALAEDALKHTSITAPFAGLIQLRHAAPGAYLSVGAPVVTLTRTNPLRYRGLIPERFALNLKVGQTVLISLEGSTHPLETQITRISPTLDEASRSLVFEADLPNPDGRLRGGLFAQAEIIVDTQQEALTVPDSAVVEFAGVEKVWRVVDGEVREVPVQTGRREPGYIEIVSGLAAGDRVLQHAEQGRPGKLAPPAVDGEHAGG